MTTDVEPTGSLEPIRTRSSELRPRISRTRAVGRVRLPLAGPYAPWATLYRLPDGRLLWCVRLWEGDRAVRRLVATDVLRAFARRNRLVDLAAALDVLVRRAGDDGA